MLMHLAHGWELRQAETPVPREIVREFIRPSVRAVPGAMAARLGHCCISLPLRLEERELSSEWRETETSLEIALALDATDPHDLALELLVCLGDALWEKARPEELESYLALLRAEIDAGVSGEIDEEALRQKQALFSSPMLARSRKQLEQYARASFAGTMAEYVHCLWHDVTVRAGPEHLPPAWLRRRLEIIARWFPPDRGYRLFPGNLAV